MSVAAQISGDQNPQESQAWRRSINLHILASTDYKTCDFWLLFSEPGKVTFDEISKTDDFRSVMHQLSIEGYAENQQTMLVDTSGYEKKNLYILPEVNSPTFIEKALWMTSLAKTLKEMKVNHLGVFLKNDCVEDAAKKQVVIEVFRQLCKSTNISNYYFMVGLQDSNLLVNYGLEIKKDLKNENINFTIFH